MRFRLRIRRERTREMPGIADHIAVLLFAVIFPVVSYTSYRSFLDRLEREGTQLRLGAYRSTMLIQLFLLVIVVAIWLQTDRPFPELGLVVPQTIRYWGGAVGAGLSIAMIVFHYVQIGQNDDYCRQTIDEMGPLAPLLPRSRRELRAFMPVAITAGIVEEVLFRGFLIWYLSHWMGILVAAGVALLIFTVAHAYQGPRGTLRVGLIGALLTVIYLLSESLYPVIALHVALDIAGGTLARHAFERCLRVDEAVDEPANA